MGGDSTRAPEKSFDSGNKKMTSLHELWDGVLRRLAGDLPAFALEAWLRPLALEAEGEALRLLCPTPFHLERVRERFLARIVALLGELLGREPVVSLAVAQVAPAPVAAAPRPRLAAVASSQAAPQIDAATAPSAPRPPPHTFDSFLVGPCNALAREAA